MNGTIEYLNEGPALQGVRTLSDVRKSPKKSAPIPMSLFSAALTEKLIMKHIPNVRILSNILTDTTKVKPNPEAVGSRSYVLTIQTGKYSLNAERQRLQHVTVTSWARDGQYAHLGISAVTAAVKKYMRTKEITIMDKDDQGDDRTGLYFIELRGFYYTLVKEAEALF